MLNDFAEEKRNPFLAIKNIIFQSLKKAFFQRGLLMVLEKNSNFFVYVDLVKIRLEIMLSDFPQVKRNLFD